MTVSFCFAALVADFLIGKELKKEGNLSKLIELSLPHGNFITHRKESTGQYRLARWRQEDFAVFLFLVRLCSCASGGAGACAGVPLLLLVHIHPTAAEHALGLAVTQKPQLQPQRHLQLIPKNCLSCLLRTA
jgi:hypothetical protein